MGVGVGIGGKRFAHLATWNLGVVTKVRIIVTKYYKNGKAYLLSAILQLLKRGPSSGIFDLVRRPSTAATSSRRGRGKARGNGNWQGPSGVFIENDDFLLVNLMSVLVVIGLMV